MQNIARQEGNREHPPARPLNVLILMAKTGGGHLSLAEALRDLLRPLAHATILDPSPPIIHYHYRLLSRHARWVWSLEYRLANNAPGAFLSHYIYTRVFAHSLHAMLEEQQPDMVLSTYPFLTFEVLHAIKRSSRPVPFVMLFADPERVHHTWLTSRAAALTLAPTRETYAQAHQAGFAPTRLHLSGWPVRAQFWQTSPRVRQDMLAQLGLDPHCFTVFVQGGGEGTAGFATTVEAIRAAGAANPEAPVQVLLAAGTNQQLLQRFQGVPNVRPIPFTPTIAPYMAAADVVMGKAGPNMLFETITLGKPFIATTFIPGQEADNLAFIRRYHLGWVALEQRDQYNVLCSLLQDRRRLEITTALVEQYRTWNTAATATIAPVIQEVYRCFPTASPVMAPRSS